MIWSNPRVVLHYLMVRLLSSKFLYASIEINIFSYDFQKHFMCKFIQSWWYFRWRKQETPLSCRNLLKSATYMDVNLNLGKKFDLFSLTMINRKWRCLKKSTSKVLNHRINTDMEELKNVLLSNHGSCKQRKSNHTSEQFRSAWRKGLWKLEQTKFKRK